MTDRMVVQVDVVAKVDEERSWWEGILATVGEDRMEEVGVTDQWSFKDLIAHMNGWQRRSLDRLAAGAQGSAIPASPWPAEYEELEAQNEDEAVERINQWIYERNRDRSVGDVVTESRQQWDKLRALVTGLTDADLNDTKRFPYLDGQSLGQSIMSGDFFGHFHEEHEPMINEWLTSRDRAA